MSRREAKREGERSVLHVLPHPGGGGETYLDALSRLEGYRFERLFLAPGARPGGALGSVLRSAAGVPRAARRHTLLHVHGEVAAGLCLPSLATRPSVVTLHGLHLLRRLDGPRRELAKANLRLIVRAATRTICVSQAEHDDVLSVVGARAARKAVVVLNGVEPLAAPSDEERAAARAELGIAAGTTVGVLVGSLEEHKDPLTAVAAALELDRAGADLTLVVVGDGPLRPQLEQAAGESGAVRILGFRSDVQRILGAADFFVLPSRREGLSYALLEAMSLGLPAVVSDGPGNPEAVGDTGIVVGCGDVAGFAAAFARLLGDPPARLALGAAARERATRCFRLDAMVDGTRQVYDDVTASKQAHRP